MTSLPTIHTFAPTGLAAPVNVRTILIDGEPWFVGADILRVLYGSANGKGSHYFPLAPDETTKVERVNLGLPPGREMMLVSESGLYRLILRSDKKEALAFQDWVTREVLPAIRKTGSYALADTARVALPLPLEISETLAALVTAQQETNRLLGELIAAQGRPGVVERRRAALSQSGAANYDGADQFTGPPRRGACLLKRARGSEQAPRSIPAPLRPCLEKEPKSLPPDTRPRGGLHLSAFSRNGLRPPLRPTAQTPPQHPLRPEACQCAP